MGWFGAKGHRRQVPDTPELVAQAAANPGGSVAEIDPKYVDDPNGYVPPEAIKGAWLVDEAGRLTGEYRENPNYGPPQDDFRKLTDPDHWLGWLGGDPAAAVREGIEDCLRQQVAAATVEWIKILDTPRFLTAGRQAEHDQTVLLVTRAALAAPFALSVRASGHPRHVLTGVFSWATANLAPPGRRRDRHWFDLDVDLHWAEERLQERLYSIDSEGVGQRE